jgi:predicted nuclease of predicted toxin-antitoxin system
MKIIADENLYNPIIDYLKDSGHEVTNIRQSDLAGSADEEIFQLACKDKSIIVTMDKDFSRIFRFPPGDAEG